MTEIADSRIQNPQAVYGGVKHALLVHIEHDNPYGHRDNHSHHPCQPVARKQKDNGRYRGKPHGISHDLWLYDLPCQLPHAPDDQKAQHHLIIGAEEFDDGPGNQHGPRPKKGKKIEECDSYGNDKRIIYLQYRKPDGQKHIHPDLDFELGLEIAAHGPGKSSLDHVPSLQQRLGENPLQQIGNILSLRHAEVGKQKTHDHTDHNIGQILCKISESLQRWLADRPYKVPQIFLYIVCKPADCDLHILRQIFERPRKP